MTKRSRIAAKLLVSETSSVRFDFADGEVVEFRLNDLPEEIRQVLALHGLAQKLGDAYSGVSDPAKAREAARQAYAALQAGEWARRGGGGRATTSVEELAAAIVAVAKRVGKKVPHPAILEKLHSDAAFRERMAALPSIKAEVRAARRAAADAEALEI